jgi:hypothetical protein
MDNEQNEFDLKVTVEKNSKNNFEIVIRVKPFTNMDAALDVAEELFEIITGTPSEGEVIH